MVKDAVRKATEFGMHITPESFSVLNRDEIVLSHDGHGYRLEAHYLRELLDGRAFAFGFSRLIEIV